jgi:hypothetical protein
MGRLALCKKYIHASVVVPYLDVTEDFKSSRQVATFKLNAMPGEGFCKRRVKRVVRKWLQYKLDKKIDIQELRKVLANGTYKTAQDLYIVQRTLSKRFAAA